MRDKLTSAVWGIAFIILGILFTGSAVLGWNFTLFFDGWWTLFIIIPSALSIVRKGFNTSGIIGLVLGSLWFLSAQEILTDGVAGKLIFPIILIVIGINIVTKNLRERSYSSRITSSDKAGEYEYSAVFGGGTYKILDEKFYGCSISAVFGGVELDLRNAIIEEDIVINASAIFGGVEVRVPNNVKVKVTGVPIFGGIENATKDVHDVNAPVVYVNATCMFGGVEFL